MVHNECITKRRNGNCRFESPRVANFQRLQAHPVSFPNHRNFRLAMKPLVIPLTGGFLAFMVVSSALPRVGWKAYMGDRFPHIVFEKL